MQRPQHGVSSLHALAKSLTIPMSLYKRYSQRQPCLPPCTRAVSSTSQLLCKQVLVGKFTLQALNTQCLGWQHFFGNKSDLQCVCLTELVHDCCPAQTTSKLNYSSILKCQTCIKVPCFEEPMRVEKVSLEMSLNCIFNLFALCGKYFWLY